jgi:two-component system, cell cycle response regulator
LAFILPPDSRRASLAGRFPTLLIHGERAIAHQSIDTAVALRPELIPLSTVEPFAGAGRSSAASFTRRESRAVLVDSYRGVRMSRSSATIFIADDNPILLQGLDRALSGNGYQVRTAETGSALLRLLESAETRPDLLLLDVMMPEMSGIEVLSTLHEDERWSEIPVILVTAATDEQLPVSALQLGAVDFLTKPFRLGELLARVDAHVGRYRELRRARGEAALRAQAIDVVRDLNSVVTADEMFRLVARRLASIWQVSRCSAFLDEGEGLCRVAASSDSEEAVGSLVRLTFYPEIEAALDRSEPILVEDVCSSPLFDDARVAWSNESQANPQLASVIAVPFPISAHTRGVLLLRATVEEPVLNEEALEIATQIVDGMTRALGRAQVFQTLVEQRRHLHDLANTDELTGCASRRAVLRYLADEWDLAQRSESPLSVVVLDLDRFKEVNDTHGHLAGDRVLREFGAWLKGAGAHRARDCAGRYGGDEFVVVLPDTGPEGAHQFAERARTQLESLDFEFDGVRASTTLSAGVASWPVNPVSQPEALLRRADIALYEAKQEGKNRVRIARSAQRLSESA